MRDVETLVCAANQAKRLADEIDLLSSAAPLVESAYVYFRKTMDTSPILPELLLREAITTGLKAVAQARAAELDSVLLGVFGGPATASVDPRKGEGPS